jgi:hypothetical protein
MPQPEASDPLDIQKLLENLRLLDQRIARLEEHLGLHPIGETAPSAPAAQGETEPEPYSMEQDGTRLELRFGEFGLSYIGSVILLLGIVFLVAYTYSAGQKLLATILGYSATVGLYLIERSWREAIPHISRLMLTSSLLLFYYTTMRLHFFSDQPILDSALFGLAGLLLAVILEIVFALHRKSQALCCLVIQLGLVCALLSDSTHLILALAVVWSAFAVRLALRRGWWPLLNVTIACVYIAHLIWLLNNPLTGRPLKAVEDPEYNLFYLFVYAGIFSWPIFKCAPESTTGPRLLVTILLNASGFSLISAIASFAWYQDSFAFIYLAAALSCLLFSIVYWRKTHEHLAPAAYACFGYMALSIAIYGYAGIPAAFLWLSLESLLVVSMALWFRSKVLVVANSCIYICVLLTYFISTSSSDWVNFGFALSALASARIMNWQKERLTLRTSALRNVYLALAFVLVLYALFHAVPSHYVTLTWTVAAVGYFALSVWLHNVKYRWMAICTMLMTVFYLFLVDLARLDAVYRVAAFLFLGLMALVISFFYTKYKRLLGRTGS